MTLLLAGSGRRRIEDAPTDYPNVPQTLITIPTPEGTGQTVHPSVVDMGAEWNGYRWWQANTPYPNDDEDTENPIIVASNDQITWEVPPGLTNPLDPWPGTSGDYHSDTELVYDPDGGRMVAYWRTTIGPVTRFKAATSTDGSTWTLHGYVSDMVETPALSPVVNRIGPGAWRMWRFGNTTLPRVYDAASPLGPWSVVHTAVCSMSGVTMPRWWHGDVFKSGDHWFMLITDSINCHPGISTDGIAWTIGPATMTGSTSMAELYRPTMAQSSAHPDWIDVWVGGFTPTPRQSRTAFCRIPKSTFLDLL